MSDSITEIAAVPAPVFTETSIIVIAICVTIIMLSVIFFVGKFKIKADKTGTSFKVGANKPKKKKNSGMANSDDDSPDMLA